MKVKVYKEEIWPAYSLIKNMGYFDGVIDIPEDKVYWVKKVCNEFNKVQDYLTDKVYLAEEEEIIDEFDKDI